MIDSKDRLWAATNFGLELVDRKRNTRKQYFKPDHLLHKYLVECLLEGPQGNIWLGTGGRGVHLLDPDSGTTRRLDQDLFPGGQNVGKLILEMAYGTGEMIWISDQLPKLHCFDPAKGSIVSHTIPHSENRNPTAVWEITPNDRESLWLGTRDNGLIYFNPSREKITYYSHDPTHSSSISSNSIGALLKTPGVLWVGHTGAGVDQFLQGNRGIEPIPLPTSPNRQAALNRIVEDHRGIIWAATAGNGLYQFDPHTNTTKHFRHRPEDPQGLAHNLVWELMVDHEGTIWVGTHRGLQRFDATNQRFHTVRTSRRATP